MRQQRIVRIRRQQRLEPVTGLPGGGGIIHIVQPGLQGLLDLAGHIAFKGFAHQLGQFAALLKNTHKHAVGKFGCVFKQ